ncbi:hypothetical protein BI335_17680 [Enemella evansiae]|uniref:hypothetical protein n=1 Tax=Enemella evansiae TaxID=2016499 RepID=UPI000B97A3E7|nr:hypothetical protein [Enemella evansiae]OYO10363.1 hypothetical protein BI335_17680 [Enemella evansiae]
MPAAAASSRIRTRTRLGIGLLVVALIGLTAWGLFAGRLPLPDNQFRALSAGDCIRLVAVGNSEPARDGSLTVGHEEVACDAGPTPMTYTVATVGPGEQSCPTTDYVEYYQVGQTSRANPTEQRQWTTCLVPNYRPDTCYADDDSTLGYQAVPCGQAASFRVDSVTDRADAQCPEPAREMVYPEPPRTFCVRPPG